MNIIDNLKIAADQLNEADAIFITSGAGVGVDSGLPDFRGNEGFWKAYPPLAKLNISFYEMANPRWFISNPDMAWGFYGHRLNLYRETEPHTGFELLLKIGEDKRFGYFVFTSNVDGQYQKAGYRESLICECHGSIHHLQCMQPCTDEIWNNDIKIEVDLSTFKTVSELPMCKNCSALARPNVLMFGDWNWIGHRTDEQYYQMGRWLRERSNKKIVIIEAGAGESVATVRRMSEDVARKYDASLIRINPRDYYIRGKGISIPLGAKEGIERIYDLIQNS
jgi:NAD-dependent SIR2 family protein deacetylase